MLSGNLFKNIRYYGAYQLLFVSIFIILCSIGSFFHFLLNHEISIVESWIHNNHWEILIIAKLLSLFLINRWFKVRLYQMKSVKELVGELVTWPEPKTLVISFFMLVSYLSLSGVKYTGENFGYWYYHFTAFFGLFLYFGIEFIVIAYLDDVLNQKEQPSFAWLSIVYTIFFTIAFRLCVPDYYQLLSYVVFCFSSLVFLSGKSFKSWSNVVCFLLVFVAPMGAIFGMDPVWGDDFSPFRVKSELRLSLLAVIWVVSFCYYKYRDQILLGVRKLYR
jgi:MFS family permease